MTKMQLFILGNWLWMREYLTENSCGAAIKGLIQLKGNFTSKDVIVVLLHDSGSRYLAKIYNDEWMKSKKIYIIFKPKD